MDAPGLLILDNNCYSALLDAGALARFRASLRVTHFAAQATEINLLESAAASPDELQERLLRSIKTVVGDRPLLPWPFQLLQRIGQAITAGEPGFELEPSGKEWYLDDLLAARERRQAVLQFNEEIEAKFSAFHDKGRQALQARLRRLGVREHFGSAREFLEGEWIGSEARRTFAEVTWTALGLTGRAPVDVLEQNEAWRILLDGEGVAAYERAVATTQPKRVQRLDLLQLIYLAGVPRRALVTRDRGLLRAGEAILWRRYLNARVVPLDVMIT